MNWPLLLKLNILLWCQPFNLGTYYSGMELFLWTTVCHYTCQHKQESVEIWNSFFYIRVIKKDVEELQLWEETCIYFFAIICSKIIVINWLVNTE